MIKKIVSISLIFLVACSTPVLQRKEPVIPSLEYSKNLQEKIEKEKMQENLEYQRKLADYEKMASIEEMRARYHFASGNYPNNEQELTASLDATQNVNINSEINGEINSDINESKGETQYFETKKNVGRPKYASPLMYGDTGRSPSLWEDSKTGGSDLFRDDRAWLPGDLVTILITEKSDAKGEADTNTKKETTLLGGISALIGIDSWFADKNKRVDPKTMFSTNSSLEYKGSGDTTRKSTLTAKISAMVMEVLPTGLLRVEGEKIVSVNSEEQIIKISGIVRPKDVNSYNEIDSSKLANMRVDYYGQGALQDVQTPGWGTRFITKLWPF
ncbi:MAG: flagellar basal body L-ring protein FlgH [Bdellovibrionota bacterium]